MSAGRHVATGLGLPEWAENQFYLATAPFTPA
jgi:hypothetical protein